MGLAITKLWRLLWSNQEHKVIIVGLDNAGKTTILYQFSMGDVIDTSPTIGSNVEEITFKNLKFVMWDIGGQETLRASWSSYYTATNFVVLVVDSSDVQRIPIIKKQLHEMLAHEELARSSLLVLANKQDVRGALSAAEISTQLGLLSIRERKWQIQGCCALTGEGMGKALDWIASNPP
ncbi:arl-5 [Pristionchus pacificus]|uniref:Arl-5 n=1 Tax=Pristionchus pacificus TaxID=54126 RepID=A0A2A6CHF4_PRIPA|nr:arl-5 [Pristionchus pacificus]|eukprot:PDM77526.1 arl-5 [Pristionchus pacificus]